MKLGKVSALRSWTSDAEARAAAPIRPKAIFWKVRILLDEKERVLERPGSQRRRGQEAI